LTGIEARDAVYYSKTTLAMNTHGQELIGKLRVRLSSDFCDSYLLSTQSIMHDSDLVYYN
jgi:hypothetical protein